MSRTVTGLATHLSGTAHTRCNMLLLALHDGTYIGITDHDETIDYDLTEAGAGTVSYSARTGILPSDIALAAGLETDNYEVQGPVNGSIDTGNLMLAGDETDGDDILLLAGDMTDGDDALTISRDIALEALLGGRLDRATAWLFQLNHKSTTDGKIPLLKGNVSEIRIEGGRFTLQIRSVIDRLNQTIGRLITPYCDADFGDARCGVVPEEITGTVTSVTSSMVFTVSFVGSFADDYFNMGTVEPLVGDLAGTRPIEIQDWFSTGVIVLFSPLAGEPGIGDTFTIKRGCSKLRKSDDASLPTCLSYSNVVNFRGFPEVPGSDQVLKIAVPSDV